MRERIYVDHAATTPVDPRVLDAMLPFFSESFGNASSIHRFGQEARAAVDSARVKVASLINASENEIVFTSGGTESNNLAIKGVLEANKRHGEHIVTTSIEHPAVREVSGKRNVTVVPVSGDGVVDPEAVAAAINERTVLVSVMAANNEIGTLQPLSEIGRLVAGIRNSGRKIYLHTDAVQAAGKIPVDVGSIGCDLLSLSAHKIYGPKGIGALYIRKGVRLASQNLGGHQERERRGGTEAVPLIVGLGEACAIASEEMARNAQRVGRLRQRFEDGIAEKITDFAVNGASADRLPNISNISFRWTEGEAILINLDMNGIAVSTGSACSSGTVEPSHVIVALGVPDDLARGAVRFSFGKGNTDEDVDRLLAEVPKAVENLRKLSPHFRSASGA